MKNIFTQKLCVRYLCKKFSATDETEMRVILENMPLDVILRQCSPVHFAPPPPHPVYTNVLNHMCFVCNTPFYNWISPTDSMRGFIVILKKLLAIALSKLTDRSL